MSRVQLALNVIDLEASITFYSTLFSVQPHKRRPGYVNFVVANPPMKLVLIETDEASRGEGPHGALNHLGIEVQDGSEVTEARQRLTDADLATFDEDDTTCCYALQDKVWAHDPAGAPWEVYVVKDDNPADGQPATTSAVLLDTPGTGSACCAPKSA
ncbi:ArsI/CadI family heavy metal resistance metalloenzyme [Mariniluteicoccus flavus]